MDSADKNKKSGIPKPWVLQLQKLGLELKCPLCLDYLRAPTLLPCDHLFCASCISMSNQIPSECPVCVSSYVHQDIRPARHMENMLAIYRTLEASIRAYAGYPVIPDLGTGFLGCPAVNRNHGDLSSKEQIKSGGNGSLPPRVNQPFELPTIHSFDNGVGKDAQMVPCTLPSGHGVESYESSEGNHRLPPLGSRLRNSGGENSEAVKIGTTQPSPGSPPSCGDGRGSDDESSDLCCKQTLERCSVKRLFENNSQNGMKLENYGSSGFGNEEGCVHDCKRSKILNNDPTESGLNQSESLAATSSQVEKTSIPTCTQLQVMSGHPNESQFVCSFCQTSIISEAIGPMLHYANGKLVDGEEANKLDVIHVHTKCVEWAPQAYFDDDTIKNLEKELARGAKLKCNKCGLKGAALGCYVKSCKRSYHVPCALEIRGVRWDTEDYLLLCPVHTAFRFPSGRYKSKKSITRNHLMETQTTSHPPSFWKDVPEGAKEWVLCGSALSSKEKLLLGELAEMAGLTVSKTWHPNVTHVIANTDANGACTRTLKVLMAISKGCWVLKIDWVKACMKATRVMDEESYEVCIDSHGSRDGPKNGRIRALANSPKLFTGLDFYFVGDFSERTGNELHELIKGAGGNVLGSKESLLAQNSSWQEHSLLSRVVIVYNLELHGKCQLGEEVTILYERLTEAQNLAATVGGQVVGHTWLLESIAACKLLPFVH